MIGLLLPRRSATWALVLIALCLPLTSHASPQEDKPPAVNPKWLERLDQVDRFLLDELIGYAPPPFTEDLVWAGTGRTSWGELRGSVVVLQSWTNGSAAGRKAPSRMERMVKDNTGKDLRIVLLHTPEDAEKLDAFLKRRQIDLPIAVDPTGVFCDALGVFRKPVNIIIDRQGVVRYAGLNPRGLAEAVDQLLAEPFDPQKIAPPRPAKEPEPAAEEYPPITGAVANARDIRGQRAPEFHVDDWMTDMPDARGRVVVLEFWETTSQPSIAAVDHMNTLAATVGNDICIVAISDDEEWEFDKNLRKTGRSLQEYRYALAVDTSDQMKRAIGIRGVPHCIVMSPDWIVRWQGNPRDLTAKTLLQIARASAGQRRPRPVTVNRDRWTGG